MKLALTPLEAREVPSATGYDPNDDYGTGSQSDYGYGSQSNSDYGTGSQSDNGTGSQSDYGTGSQSDDGNGSQSSSDNGYGSQSDNGTGSQSDNGYGSQSSSDNGNGSQSDYGYGSQSDNGYGSQSDNGNGSQSDNGNGSQSDNGTGSQSSSDSTPLSVTVSGPATVDPRQPVTFSAVIAGDSGGITYQWWAYKPYWNLGSGGTGSDGTFEFPTPGDYTVRVDVTNRAGAYLSAYATVHVNPWPAFTATVSGPDTVDPRQPVTFSATAAGGTNTGYSYQWWAYKPYTNLGSGGNESDGEFTFPTPGDYTVRVDVYDDAGNLTSGYKTVHVNPWPALVVTVTGPSAVVPGEDEQYTVTATGGTGTGYSYQWYAFKPYVGLDGGTDTTAVFNFPVVGDYTVRVDVYDDAGNYVPGYETVHSSGYVDHYPEYVAAVNAAGAEYRSNANVAYSQYQVEVSAADGTAFSAADLAYTDYLNTANAAYDTYHSLYNEAYNVVQRVLNQANADLASDAANVDSTLQTTLEAAGIRATDKINLAWNTFQNDLTAAETQCRTTSEADWNDDDIEAMDTDYDTYLSAVAAAADSFNAAVDAAFDESACAYDSAGLAMEDGLSTADDNWTRTMTAAVTAFDAVNDPAWNQYVADESAAWSRYQTKLSSIRAQQQSDYDSAWNQFQNKISDIGDIFDGKEADAWGTYLQTLAPAQTVGARLNGRPVFVAAEMPPAAVADNDPLKNFKQKLPPIDWSKGKVVIEETEPLPMVDLKARVFELKIGEDKDGKPINILYWQALPGYKLEYQWFCHGQAFAGGGAMSYSPDTDSVKKILDRFYKPVDDSSKLKPNDVVEMINRKGDIAHSCTIMTVALAADGTLDDEKTMVLTKDGLFPLATKSLRDCIDFYRAVNKDNPPVSIKLYTPNFN